jgi:DedD protein
MQKLQKHRLVLLLGILIALIFFYFGVNTWMESQQKQVSPPPVVRSKPPVQIKPKTQPVKPAQPKPAPKPKEQVKKPPEKPQPKAVAQKKTAQPKTQEPRKEKPKMAQTETKPAPKKTLKEKQEPKKEVTPQPKQVAKKSEAKKQPAPAKLKEYVVQIGAFKVKENAQRRLKVAKQSGYEAFIIEEDGLYKVRVRVKSENLISALKKVRSSFRNAFVVLR